MSYRFQEEILNNKTNVRAKQQASEKKARKGFTILTGSKKQ